MQQNENSMRNIEIGRGFKKLSCEAENKLYNLTNEDHRSTFTPPSPDPMSNPGSRRVQIGLANQAIVSLLQRIHRELKIITRKVIETEENEGAASQWKFAAMVVDRFCFYMFSFFILTTVVVIMIFAPYLIA